MSLPPALLQNACDRSPGAWRLGGRVSELYSRVRPFHGCTVCPNTTVMTSPRPPSMLGSLVLEMRKCSTRTIFNCLPRSMSARDTDLDELVGNALEAAWSSCSARARAEETSRDKQANVVFSFSEHHNARSIVLSLRWTPAFPRSKWCQDLRFRFRVV